MSDKTRGRKKSVEKNGSDTQDSQFKNQLDVARAEAKASKARMDDLEAKLQRLIARSDAKDDAGAVTPPDAGDDAEEKLRHGTFAFYKRAGSAAQAYTYKRCSGTLTEIAEEIQAPLGPALSQATIRALMNGHVSLVVLSHFLPAPHGWQAKNAVAADALSTVLSSGYVGGKFSDKMSVQAAIRTLVEVIRCVKGPSFLFAAFLVQFLAALDELAAGLFHTAVTTEDLLYAFDMTLHTHFRNVDSLIDPATHTRALKFTLVDVRSFAALLNHPADPAGRPRAEPKGSGERGVRSEAKGTNEKANGRPRDRSRERDENTGPRAQVCRDFNAGKCTRTKCRYEHVCAACNRPGHGRDSRQRPKSR